MARDPDPFRAIRDQLEAFDRRVRLRHDQEERAAYALRVERLDLAVEQQRFLIEVAWRKTAREEIAAREPEWRERRATLDERAKEHKAESEKRREEERSEGEGLNRERARLERLRGLPLWEVTKPEVAPKDEEMLTMQQVVEVFKERLGVSRATFYRQFRKHLTVHYLGQEVVHQWHPLEQQWSRGSREGTMRARRSDVEALINHVVAEPIVRRAGRGER